MCVSIVLSPSWLEAMCRFIGSGRGLSIFVALVGGARGAGEASLTWGTLKVWAWRGISEA